MVNVYNSEGEIIGEVKYNTNLDFWDGRNWTSGGTGCHKGLTRLKTGQFVLIYGTDWIGQKDRAEIISAEQAVQEILKSGNHGLFKEHPELEAIREETIIQEA